VYYLAAQAKLQHRVVYDWLTCKTLRLRTGVRLALATALGVNVADFPDHVPNGDPAPEWSYPANSHLVRQAAAKDPGLLALRLDRARMDRAVAAAHDPST
jgi:hypothetical protein